MRLQTILHIDQRNAVHLRCCHNIGAEVNQQINEDRFRKLEPPSARACSQLIHLQKASGNALAAEVPRNVISIFNIVFDLYSDIKDLPNGLGSRSSL